SFYIELQLLLTFFFPIKIDDRLFYVGPSRQYIRLVVLSEEEKRSVLTECHNNPGTGNHSGVRGTQNRVIAGYYWSTIIQDVKEWVRSCHRCQLNDPIKTVVPVLHSIKVKEPWEVLGLDLIGPLPETAHNNKYVLTMTDLYTKWVIAEPMQSKTAAEGFPQQCTGNSCGIYMLMVRMFHLSKLLNNKIKVLQCYLYFTVCSQHLYIMPTNIHRGKLYFYKNTPNYFYVAFFVCFYFCFAFF
uniref:Integrase zinc-binding domain-containing protein n=1 Tax=Sinocyclocheilus anshuiensis TaxID=1608454 RepID=A0A671QDZ5_9TELE